MFSWFGWFAVMNFIVMSGLVSRYLKYAGNIDTILAKIYIPLAIIGHLSSILLVVSLLIFLPLILISPNLYSFISNHPTQDFTNHTSGGNGTRVGIFTLFYGIFGSNWASMSSEQIGPVFIKHLLKNNYQMGIFASSKLTRPAFNQTVFHDIENLRSYSQGDSSWERDMNITKDWKSWFHGRDEDTPFFSFLFYDSPHAYTYPDDYEKVFEPVLSKVHYHKLNNDFDPVPYFNRYKRSVHYVDFLIKEVVDDLEDADVLDNTLIVISGDHGQEFNDNRQNF